MGSVPDTGFSLDLNRRMTPVDREEEESRAMQEQEVEIEFTLPHGQTASAHFKMGHTVLVLKSYIATELGYPIGSQELYLRDKKMLDPYTLNDFDDIRDVQVVEITVDIANEA